MFFRARRERKRRLVCFCYFTCPPHFLGCRMALVTASERSSKSLSLSLSATPPRAIKHEVNNRAQIFLLLGTGVKAKEFSRWPSCGRPNRAGLIGPRSVLISAINQKEKEGDTCDQDHHSLSLSIFSLCWETSAVKKEKYQKGGWATANSHQTNHPQTSATLIYTLQSDVSNESPKEGATQANGSISRYPIAETFLSSFRGVTSSTPFGSALKSFAPLWTIWEPPDQSSVWRYREKERRITNAILVTGGRRIDRPQRHWGFFFLLLLLLVFIENCNLKRAGTKLSWARLLPSFSPARLLFPTRDKLTDGRDAITQRATSFCLPSTEC